MGIPFTKSTKLNSIMDMDFKVAEVELAYKPTRYDKVKVTDAYKAYALLRATYKEGQMQYREYFKVIYMNQAGDCVAYNTVGEGGITECPADIRLILQGALLTNATRIIVAHNHPSGYLNPSRDDDKLTMRIKEACETLRIHFDDHLVISEEGYYSYREQGRI